ncbi:MAP kinase-activated protein kinase 5 isoform X2 [Lingula anatina]|uniref:MAP kinase-activated protein kinase 5 isoform X2 n=1 Tax=Lingula anatina TaxID=7574 RepID=A0A1S3IUJ4_LINAN|nr:MAP kinase-activated protein kinase 5 isoform X2 [Lingula anatina]|eukprot:XP_013401601.1 MAP kinase-activated protein kinase 5 isoform X2 [Lingula anatina]
MEEVKATHLKIKTNSILDDYDVIWNQKLGTGISGPVRPCIHKKTKERCALKCLADRPKARTECTLQYQCSGHPNIVGVYSVYANEVQFPGEPLPRPRLFIVMELMKGGELFDRITKKKHFTEREAAKYTRQITAAVARCHSLNIAHRDLKPENLLFKDNSEDALIKLSDFGFAKIDDGTLKTPQFTPYYVAPQILEAQARKNLQGHVPGMPAYTYDKSCDMWSIGVIVYIMLCGYPPFYSETPSRQMTNNMKKKIMAGEYTFPTEDWKNISVEAKDVVRRLLDVDPTKRMNIVELQHHVWLQYEAPETMLMSPAILMDKVSLEEARLMHAQQLTNMRQPDLQITLKPMKTANNPILKKRLHNLASKNSLEPPEKSSYEDIENIGLQKLQDVILYCLTQNGNGNKEDNTDLQLCSLLTAAIECNQGVSELQEMLHRFKWNGSGFDSQVNKHDLAAAIDDLVLHRRQQIQT